MAAFTRIAILASLFFLSVNSLVASEPWKFAVLCDTRGDNNTNAVDKTGINDAVLEAMAAGVVSDGCDLVLIPGDLINGWWANGGTSCEEQFSNWRNAMEPVYSAGIKVYPVRGNHENGSERPMPLWLPEYPLPDTPEPMQGIKEDFKSAFNDPYIPGNGPTGEQYLTFSFSTNNAFFAGLDEYINPHKVNQTWLNSQFSSNTLPHVFVFGHEPAFKINHSDCLAYFPTNRNEFWNSIGSAGGMIYFCGHDHLYNRAHVFDNSGNKIHQLVVGSGGAPLVTWSPPYDEGTNVVGEFHNDTDYGYVVVTIDGKTATVEWKAWDGVGDPGWITMDSFTYTVPASLKNDYNGDRVSDLAVYGEETGIWYILTVSGGLLVAGVNWGFSECVPVPGDYDGDGVSDLAVFHESTGTILFGQFWGGVGLVPVD